VAKISASPELTCEDLLLLCDLFYLPYEHGAQGLQILHEFQWLKANLSSIAGESSKDKIKPEVNYIVSDGHLRLLV
jgi:protein O-GlcNAcase/histone acetyltransferase